MGEHAKSVCHSDDAQNHDGGEPGRDEEAYKRSHAKVNATCLLSSRCCVATDIPTLLSDSQLSSQTKVVTQKSDLVLY